MNNIATDLPQLISQSHNWQIKKLKTEWDQYLQAGNSDKWGQNLTAYYNLADSSKNRPISNILPHNKKHLSFSAPYIGFNLQNMETWFTPSVQLGANLSFLNAKEEGQQYLLYLEKYFFMDRSVAGTRKLHINNFLCFQFRQADEKEGNTKEKLDFNLQFSLGYLITRSGNYFEKNSFHLTVPGLAYKNLQLSPGLFFNNLFNRTTPTLKLTLYLE